MRAPFAVTWSPAAIETATQTVQALLAFHAGDGGAEIFRRQSQRDVFAALGDDGSASAGDVLDRLEWRVPPRPRVDPLHGNPSEYADTLEFVLGQMPPDSSLGIEAREYCRRWEGVLEAAHTQRTYILPCHQPRTEVLPGPAGTVLLHLAADAEYWMGVARPEAALFAARFGSLLADEAAADEAPVFAALRRINSAPQCGVRPVEIVGWDAANPNAALHSLLTDAWLAPHTPGDELQLVADSKSERVWLRRSDRGELFAPIYSTGADIGFNDVCGRLLLVVAAGHGWEFPSLQMPPLRAERTRWRHAPRLLLAGGEVLRPERWTIDRKTLDHLSKLRGAPRYLAWRREMLRLGAPDLVHVCCGPRQTPLLVRIDSPLAVRCLLDTCAADAPWMELTELAGAPEQWPLQDAAGNHYLAELAVSWSADGYWQAVAPTGGLRDVG
jgi:hypothetical protein